MYGLFQRERLCVSRAVMHLSWFVFQNLLALCYMAVENKLTHPLDAHPPRRYDNFGDLIPAVRSEA